MNLLGNGHSCHKCELSVTIHKIYTEYFYGLLQRVKKCVLKLSQLTTESHGHEYVQFQEHHSGEGEKKKVKYISLVFTHL
jgi:hypothetical protein